MIHRSKVKVIKMLMVVIILFACSWLPLYAIFTRIKLGGPLSPGPEESLVHALLPVAQWLGASNSCINPILYAFFNKKFRAGFKAVLSSRSCCSPLRYDYSTQMTLHSRETLYQRKRSLKKIQKRKTLAAHPRPEKPSTEQFRSQSLRTLPSDALRREPPLKKTPSCEYSPGCNGTFV
jgi:hypothetical protein